MCSVFGIVDFENRYDAGLVFPQSPCGRRSVYITNCAMLLRNHCVDTASENKSGSMTLAFHERLYTVVYSGRIFNADILRCELSNLGAAFTCGGTAEILIYSYIFFGTDCIKKLSGDFICSIYDEQGERLFLQTGTSSDKNLYYAMCDTAFVFSSQYAEVKKYMQANAHQSEHSKITTLEPESGLIFDKTGISK